MKGIFTTLAFILAFSALALCQSTNVCPAVKVIAPMALMLPGEIINFSAEVSDDAEISNLKSIWTVSDGVIIEGQNTSAIKVITTSDMQGITITARVEVRGLPENCDNKASETAEIASVPICRCNVDEYGKLAWRDEMARLQNVAIELRNNPNSRAHILFNVGENLTLNQAKKHIRKMTRYLESLGIEKKRLLFAIKPSEFRSTVFSIFPHDAKLPSCDECEFINGENIR